MKKFVSIVLCLVLMLAVVSDAMAVTLKLGARGAAVRQIQKALNSQGYASLTVDGVYGKGTEAAVRHFQQMKGLAPDGKAGPKTQKALLGTTNLDKDPEPVKPTPKPQTVFRLGSSGSTVREIQTLLRKYGYFNKSVDGVYGKTTVAAVRSFQQLNGLAADGTVGPKTLAALKGSNVVRFYVPTKYPTLRPGSTGDMVTRLQKGLNKQGYSVAVTGYYNAETTAAVRDYQTKHNLDIDGVAGQKTLSSLLGK